MLFWVVGSVIGLVGLVVAAWALWGDRARGRKRCGRCWYSMEGVNGLTCPECGRAAKGERRLLRTRRRWWRAVGGVAVMVVGAVVVVMPELQKTSAITWLPRPALVVLVRWTDTEGGAAFEELVRRANPAAGAGVCVGWPAWEVRWLAEHAGEVVGREAVVAQAATAAKGLRELEPSPKVQFVNIFNLHRVDIFMMLAGLGPAGAPAIPGVVRAAQDSRMTRSARVALASIGVGDDRAVDEIAAALSDADDDLDHRVLVASLLQVAVTLTQRTRAESALISALASDDMALREAIVEELARNASAIELGEDLLLGVAKTVRAGPEHIAEAGARVLMRRPDVAAPMIDAMVRGGTESYAPATLRAICMQTPPPMQLADTVRWAVEHADTQTRWAAANAAICIGSEDAEFVKLLARRTTEEQAPRVRSAALWAVYRTGPVEVAREAAIAALGDADVEVRGSAVGVLEQLGAKDAAAREALCAGRVEPNEKLAARVQAWCAWWEVERGGE